jgi:DNA primase
LNISEEIIQKVKESNDIVDIISETVKLKRAGRYYTGLCPFHHEKSPSFTVTSDKQIYKCFGCGEAGNVITFVMKTKNLDFVESVKLLAEKAHIEIATENPRARKEQEANNKLYKINVEAARYFFSNLKINKTALSYFYRRGITQNTIVHFGLGYAPQGWNNIMNFLKTKGYTELDMVNAGLIVKNENNKIYDRFRNRIIFPVFDYKGKVIGFGGRVLDDSKPKYLNSPETVLFKKGTNLYGLNFAVKNLKEKTLIIVEGYMDCIALHQQGITNVVASLGTALTPSQAKLLKRYADKIIISYDADLAGQNATIRGLEILKTEGFDIRVLTVPEGKDPDEFIRNNGKEAFLSLINTSLPLTEYKLKMAKEGIDFKSPTGAANYASNASQIIAELNPVEKDIYIKKISEETGIKEQAIYDLISGEIQKNVNKSENVNTVDNFGQKLYLEPSYLRAERTLLRLMHDKTDAYNYITNNFQMDSLIDESHKKIYELIVSNINLNKEEREKLLQLKCNDVKTSKEWITLLEQDNIDDEGDHIKYIEDCIKEITKFRLEENKRAIINRIRECELKGLLIDSVKLAQQLVEIQKELAKL